MGIRVLVNESVEIARGGDRFWLAGTGDPAGDVGPINRDRSVAPDIDRTLARVPRGAFTIALAHNPVLWPALAQRGVQVTLSGHTHHGQLSIPHMDWSLASHFLEHAMGSHRRGDAWLYINPGTNYWGLPLRLGAWPEVTVITLRAAPLAERVA
jgi:predicted MPP superfamily phosphohydrolase